MSMIGNQVISTDFPVDYFSGNGSTTAFTLSIAPASVNAVAVTISGVKQSPKTYTVSETTLTFSAAPPSGTDNIVVEHKGIAGIPNVPSAASVTSDKLATQTSIPFATSSLGAGNASIMKNRIINGAMVIDQRNAGASVTPTNLTYNLDRWACLLTQASKFTVQQNAGSVTPPVGFSKYLGVTSSSAYSVTSTDRFTVYQVIEGLNAADLAWGTADAKTVTLSFWVRSSLTGTFSGSLRTGSGTDYSYVFTYSIPVANTWTQINVTIAGPTVGTWATDNSAFVYVAFSLGVGSTLSTTAGSWTAGNYWGNSSAVNVVGTNGATFYITGVQLEVGSSATGYEYRQYGQELALCQRYYERSYDIGSATGSFTNGWRGCVTSPVDVIESPAWSFAVPKRTGPTVTLYNAVSGASGKAYQTSTAANVTATTSYVGQTGIGLINFPGQAASNGYFIHYTADAEL